MRIMTSLSAPLRIDALLVPGCAGQIGMTICPGKHDFGLTGTVWRRDLDIDLDAIVAWGADAVVTLLEQEEFELLRVAQLPVKLQEKRVEWHHLSIADQGVPGQAFEAKWRLASRRLGSILDSGGKLLLHCRGGLGRTGLVAARLLIERGIEPDLALRLVRNARPGAVETNEQERYVLACCTQGGGNG